LCTVDCAFTEPEWEIEEEQSSDDYGGPQAISCVDTNLAFNQDKP
jgi:hypothetical protein